MADVTLKYKGATIGELSESGSKTIETAGKYCEADILLEYVKSGGSVTNGIVFNSVDSNGFPLTADFYGGVVVKRGFYNYSVTDGLFKNLTSLTLHGTTTIGDAGLQNCGALTEIKNTEYITSLSGGYQFAGCRSLQRIELPLCKTSYTNTFNNCTSLQFVQLGSIGNGVDAFNNSFSSCTQSGLTIEYWIASNQMQYFDTIVSRIRNQATNATIVMKAATAVTYNGVSYAAGDTILTSTP